MQGDHDTAQRLAHAIKGVVKSICASDLSLKAKDVALAARQQLDELGEMLEEMGPEAEGKVTELKQRPGNLAD